LGIDDQGLVVGPQVVARPFAFEGSLEDGLHTYRYTSDDGGLFEKNWPGLFGEWPERGPTPWSEYAVNNNNCEEVAIYLGLIWRLTEGLIPFGVPRYYRDEAMYAAGAPYALVGWEYEVGDRESGELGEVRGFVRARSCVRLSPPPTLWEQEHVAEAGFFELPVFPIFKEVIAVLLGDSPAELNFYALEKGTVPQVVEGLKASDPPTLQTLLSGEAIFVDLVIGVDDEGYGDVIVIQSRDDLDDILFPLVQEYEASIEAYEADIDTISTVDEFLDRMAQLLNLGQEGELSRLGA